MTQAFTDRAIELAASLAEAAGDFYRRGWVLGTSGNFSAVVCPEPLRLVITASGKDKGRPSDETKLHLTIVRHRPAMSVLHTHSVWSATLSTLLINDSGIEIAGLEMLKGLSGVRTHEHREWLPILDNSQDMVELARKLKEILRQRPDAHGFLL